MPEPAVKPLPQRDKRQRWSVASHSVEGKRYEVTRSHIPGVGVGRTIWTCECGDHRFRVKDEGDRCKHADQVAALLAEQFAEAMEQPAADAGDQPTSADRRCTRCGEEWTGPGTLCETCLESS